MVQDLCRQTDNALGNWIASGPSIVRSRVVIGPGHEAATESLAHSRYTSKQTPAIVIESKKLKYNSKKEQVESLLRINKNKTLFL